MPLDSREFRDTMSHLAGAVSVVIVRDGAAFLGMTANTVTSLSLEPPLLLVCVDRGAIIADAITSSDLFAVSFLAADQEDIARRFADRERARFDSQPKLSPAGLPVIPGALAHLDCRRTDVFEAGDHRIVVASPEWSETREGAALIYFRRRYGGFA
ncbi:MAG TPA: flavin reductase family protein [Gemmatimonadales bacterium]|nr:flavin reductase family protein [Gemmatimonadales bacterium]